MNKIIISLFLSGILLGSGPCLASCGPILISYIAGTKKNILKGVLTYILFSSARIVVYLILSLMVFLGSFTLERLLGSFSKFILIIGGSFVILIGILMALGTRLKLPFCRFLGENILGKDKKSIIIMGLLIGLLPCAPLLAVLSYIGLVSKSVFQSLIYAFSFGLGTFASPLLLLSILAGVIPKFLSDKKAIYAQIFSLICGLIIIFLGLNLLKEAF